MLEFFNITFIEIFKSLLFFSFPFFFFIIYIFYMILFQIKKMNQI